MKINIKATNIELTPKITEYVDKKIGGLDKFIGEDSTESYANVEVGKTTNHHKLGDVFKAEVSLNIGGKNFYVSEETGDLYASIDKVKDEISNVIKSQKKKNITLVRKGQLRIKNMMKGFPGDWGRRRKQNIKDMFNKIPWKFKK